MHNIPFKVLYFSRLERQDRKTVFDSLTRLNSQWNKSEEVATVASLERQTCHFAHIWLYKDRLLHSSERIYLNYKQLKKYKKLAEIFGR